MEKFGNGQGTQCLRKNSPDKLTPAMAQIVLRKTTKENMAYPEVSEVLKKYSYKDDNCGSLDTVVQAQRLTGDLDKALQGGGFAVKGCTSNKVPTNRENQEWGLMFQEEVLGVI